MTDALMAAGSFSFLYANPIKIAVAVALLYGWAAGVQWVDNDTNRVKTKREHWNMIVLAGGFVGYLALFIPPWSGGLFVLGMVFWALVSGGAMLAYVIHRNARVSTSARILTLSHAKRLLKREKAESASTKGIRVQLVGGDGNKAVPPADPEEARDYDAVQDFLYDVLWRRAEVTDVVAGKEKFRLVYRVDGVANEAPEGLAADQGERVFRYLKKLAGLNVDEIRRPQTGKIRCALLGHAGEPPEAEVRTSGTMQGERLTLKTQSGPELMRLPDLGFATPRLETLKSFLQKPHGLVLITAPPRNGITTTQYAILKSHDAYINNIYALEREKLLDLDNITQQVFEGSNQDVNFARTLQSVLRREPDIVLIDNCEDHETAMVAARAAAEDRKIYMGLHARDTFDALNKFLTLLGDNKMAAKAMLGITNQRLVRLLCTDCREGFKPDPNTLKKLNLPADKIDMFYRPPSEQKVDRKGRPILCQTCRGTGYVGRTGVFEVLAVDEAVSALIAEGAPVSRIKSQCRKNRMYYLQEEAILKVIEGVTSMPEILRCISSGNEERKG